MRRDLGLSDSAELAEVVNAFAGSDLAGPYSASKQEMSFEGSPARPFDDPRLQLVASIAS